MYNLWWNPLFTEDLAPPNAEKKKNTTKQSDAALQHQLTDQSTTSNFGAQNKIKEFKGWAAAPVRLRSQDTQSCYKNQRQLQEPKKQ